MKNDVLNQAIIDTIHEPLIVLDSSLAVVYVSRSFYSTFQVAPVDTIDRNISELGNGQWNIPELLFNLKLIHTKYDALESFEVSHDFEQLGHREMKLNARKVFLPDTEDNLILLAINDITEQKLLREREKALLIAKERLNVLHATMRTVSDIVNNTLNSYQYIKMKITNGENPDPQLLNKIGDNIQQTATKLKKLGDMQSTPEISSSIGKVIDYK